MDIWQGSAGSFIALASVSQRLRNTSHGFSGFSHRVWSVLWFHTTSCRITYHPDQWQSQPVLADTLAQWDKCFLRVHGLAIVSVKFELAFGAPGYKPCISSFQLTQSLFAWMTLHKWKSRWLCKMGLVIGIVNCVVTGISMFLPLTRQICFTVLTLPFSLMSPPPGLGLDLNSCLGNLLQIPPLELTIEQLFSKTVLSTRYEIFLRI